MCATKTGTAVTGAAGEHFVMGELLRRGHIAALAPQGAPNMDILIADRSGQQLFSVQVKTRASKGGDRGWHMSEKHESITGDKLFYVFVDLSTPQGEAPAYFVMPANAVARAVRETHAAWARNPGFRGSSEARLIRCGV